VSGAKHSSRILTRAIVRPPSPNFADGLTTVDLGVPIFELASKQHAAYCVALEACGLSITHLEADPAHPETISLEMSEFQKMDGGLSCLSLRF
jgi:dimethylargininase